MEKNYKELLHQIKAFVFDVDGVLTDGRLLLSESGELLRTMNAKDGYAMKAALNAGFEVCIITGGKNEGVKSRLVGLGITDVFLNAHDKIVQLNEYKNRHDLLPEDILYMGDDMPDVPVMKAVGLACCPQDAIPEVKNVAHYISHRNGGNACVRDVIEQVMKVQKKWNVKPDSTITSS
jgi:3-deoxy-D-manno-octulosonate 8-phosphate phosphatase (KDO 8-P phosphatase)